MTLFAARPGHRPLTLLTAAAVVGALCWGAGFIWFLQLTARPAAPPPPHVDGVVALTGGAGRVELALHLLATGQADKLLVSGIGGSADLPTLARLARIDVSALAPSITLGRYAASTQGNAVEAAAWAAQNRIRTIIVVTAAYHMPRALAELRQALPLVRLYPLPVEPALASGADDARIDRGPTLRLQAEEYIKYLLVLAGVSPWFPHRAAISNMVAKLSANG
ncbi:YdcF family protein [Rhodopila sp.]|uniref:YdcF family protein n=1 Tax=Rhodopila sp. TaxID=2480087 RepID=UPI003D12EE5B